MIDTTDPTLFELPVKVAPVVVVCCHYCGGPLSEKDMLLPHTCEESLICVRCCQPCHGAALERLMAKVRATGNFDAYPRPPVRTKRPVRRG